MKIQNYFYIYIIVQSLLFQFIIKKKKSLIVSYNIYIKVLQKKLISKYYNNKKSYYLNLFKKF